MSPALRRGRGKRGWLSWAQAECGGFSSSVCPRLCPHSPKKTKTWANIKKEPKTFMDAPPQKRGIVALCFLQHPRTSNQWVWVCMLFFCASVKAIECHWRSSRVNKVNHMPYVPYLSRASRSVFGCGFRFFGLSPSSPRWWESDEPPVYAAPTRWILLVSLDPRVH